MNETNGRIRMECINRVDVGNNTITRLPNHQNSTMGDRMKCNKCKKKMKLSGYAEPASGGRTLHVVYICEHCKTHQSEKYGPGE